MRNILFSFLFLSFPVFTAAQTSAGNGLSQKIDELISGSYQSIAPGCAVLVASKGQIVYKKAFGIADLELNVPMHPGMIFRIGSVTKQFTAVAILKLVEEGKISWNDSIQQFIKNFPYKKHVITIENLLTHTSGITGYDVLDFHIPNAIRIDISPKQFIDSLAPLPLEFIPGTKYHYSNSNYLLLGYIIEQVTGKSYQKYLEENIFKQAGLSDTHYDSPAKIIANRVKGYVKDSAGYRNADYISMVQVFSAGALVSNVTDLFKWHQALYSNKLVKKEILEKAFTPFRLSDGKLSEYGYGWFIANWGANKYIAHGGEIDGFRAMELYVPGKDIFVTALFNSENDAFLNVTMMIADLVMGKTAPPEVIVSDAVLDSYTGVYQYADDPNDKLKVYKKGGKLYADLSNATGKNMVLAAQSDTKFILPDIRRITTTIDFIVEKGKVTRLIWTQERRAEFKKIE